MGYELVNRISIKNGNVYLSSHSNNDNAPFHSHEIQGLSRIYQEKGQEGLDREIINMAFNYIEFRGSDPSVRRYFDTIRTFNNSVESGNLRRTVWLAWKNLPEEDQKSIGYGCVPTPAAVEYQKLEKETEELRMRKILELIPINPQTYKFDLINVKGEKAIFFNSRMPDYLVPKGLCKHEILADVNTGLPIAVKNKVGENHFFGSILLKNDIAAGESGLILCEGDFKLIEPSKVTLAQYRRLVK